jgi:Transmembrane domain of unknown function (DUF3566)
LSPKEERPRNWRAEPEATSASGGHLSPGLDATGPLFDPLFDPLPPDSETSGRGARKAQFDSTAAAEAPVRRPDAGDVPAVQTIEPTRRRRARKKTTRPTVRRVKRTVKRVDPFTVLKLSLFYYACFLIVWAGVVAVIYWIVQSMGIFDAIEDFSTGFALEWDEIDISLWMVERWALLIGGGLAILGALINAFLAVLYNLASDLVGGLEVTFVERDL